MTTDWSIDHLPLAKIYFVLRISQRTACISLRLPQEYTAVRTGGSTGLQSLEQCNADFNNLVHPAPADLQQFIIALTRTLPMHASSIGHEDSLKMEELSLRSDSTGGIRYKNVQLEGMAGVTTLLRANLTIVKSLAVSSVHRPNRRRLDGDPSLLCPSSPSHQQAE